MRFTLLLVSLILTLLNVQCRFINIPDGYQFNDIVLYDCYWLCDNDGDTWAKFMECGLDEVATGTCGVDDRGKDCDDGVCNGQEGYSAIKCCKVDVIAQKIEA